MNSSKFSRGSWSRIQLKEIYHSERPRVLKDYLKLTAFVHVVVQEHINLGNNRRNVLFSSVSLPDSKQWIHRAPFPVIKTQISPRSFSVWRQYYFRVPLFAPDIPCPKVYCSESRDIFVDLIIHRVNWRERIDSHN